MKPQPAGNEFAAFIGIDWADAKHDIFPVRSFGRRASELPHPNTETAQNDAGQPAWPQRHRMPGHEHLWAYH